MRFTIAVMTLGTMLTGPAWAQELAGPGTPSITVRGEASAKVVPDAVVVMVGVVTERPTAGDAVTDNSQAVSDAVAAIKAEGVRPEDIATDTATLTPETAENGKSPPKIVGYRAENHLRVRLRSIDGAGLLLGKLVGKGINDIESVTPIVSDDPALRDRLKAEAAQDARRQAAIYATALNLTLGSVMRIEPEPAFASARMAVPARFNAAVAAVPIEAGQQEIAERVRVTFSLQPR